MAVRVCRLAHRYDLIASCYKLLQHLTWKKYHENKVEDKVREDKVGGMLMIVNTIFLLFSNKYNVVDKEEDIGEVFNEYD